MAKRILHNVKVEWCNFKEKDDFGHKGCNAILSPEHVAKLEEWNVGHRVKDGTANVKNEKYQFEGKFIKAQQRDTDFDGNETGPVPVVDINMKPFTEIIGNGSLCNLKLDVYEYKGYGGGTTFKLDSVQVIELIPYGDDEDFGSPGEPDTGDQVDTQDNPF